MNMREGIVSTLLLISSLMTCSCIISISSGESNHREPIEIDTITTRVQIDPGESFYIYFDPNDVELAAEPPYNLPEECDDALALVPEWMRSNLSYKFRQLSSSYRTTFADLILNSPEDRYIDEIGFAIAHSAIENLEHEYFFPELLTHNAQLIYENDQYLSYVEVVEKDNYTTVIYKDQNDDLIEVPKDIYYWYIVLPKLSDELATYVDPDYNFIYDFPHDRNYGVPPPTGKFWRDWLFYYNDTDRPILKEYLENATNIREAISKCNQWMGGSMSFTNDEERPIQPVRIYRKHIGRCGEYQDMRNAIARAGLIPSTCTCNMAEDHVWNEFWDQRWIHWDGDTDNPMKYENGWGKKISSVWNTRGDSDIWSVTSKYTEICNYTPTVLDASGLPVDGALVRVATENFYDPEFLSTTTWGTTDYTGTVTIPLGDLRNYWSSAESDDLGNDPLNGVTQVISNSSVGANYTYTFNLPMSASTLRGTNITPPSVEDERFRMEVDYEVVANIVNVKNAITEELLGYEENGDLYGQGGNIDFFIADSMNYNRFIGDLSFNAYHIKERSASGNATLILPNENRYYAVLSNGFSQKTTMIVEITVKVFSGIEVEITGPPDGFEVDQGLFVFITGTSWGPWGINTVEIDVDGLGNWMQAADTSGLGEEPYSSWQFNLDTTQIKPGLHTILAKASSNDNSSVAEINIRLIDVTDPVVEIENPEEGTIYWLDEVLRVNGTATDNGWINVLKLIIDSDEVNSTDLTPFLTEGYWSYDLLADDLGYGDHTITVWANDTASNQAMVERNIRIQERIPPEVSIDYPLDRSIFEPGDMINISGTATDNMEILSLEMIIDDDPVDITSELTLDGLWSYNWQTESTSSEGEHLIEVNATDGSSNSALAMITVILDGSKPEITIENPEEDSSFLFGEILIVDGTATDIGCINVLKLIIDFDEVNSIDLIPFLEDGYWSYDLNTNQLNYGDHTLTVWANDTFSNNDSASRDFRLTETIRPEVLITTPSDGLIFREGETLEISGIATDNWEVINLVIFFDEGLPNDITSNLDMDGAWSYSWETASLEGVHTIEVVATDASGNTDTVSISIILDDEPPDVNILAPKIYQIFKAGVPITIKGNASDDWELKDVYLQLDSNDPLDITSDVVNENWEYSWDTYGLGSGEHVITIYVNDSVGYSSEASVIVLIDTENPEVEILDIQELEEVPLKIGKSILLKGTVYDDIGINELILTIDNDEQINITSKISDGTWEYKLNTSIMSEGMHTISVILTDLVANQISEDLYITLDGTPPEAEIDAPEEDRIFKAGVVVTIQGKASDNLGLEMIQIEFDNEMAVDITSEVVSGDWRYDWDTTGIKSGEHDISLVVTDAAGHESEASITILIDTNEPEAFIDLVDEPIEIGEKITLHGTAYDDVGIKELLLVINDSKPIDITSIVENENWEYELDTSGMAEGEHMISIIVTDHVDNQASDDIKIDLVQGTDGHDDGPPDSPLDEDETGEKDSSGFFSENTITMFFILTILLVVIVFILFYIGRRKKKSALIL